MSKNTKWWYLSQRKPNPSVGHVLIHKITKENLYCLFDIDPMLQLGLIDTCSTQYEIFYSRDNLRKISSFEEMYGLVREIRKTRITDNDTYKAIHENIYHGGMRLVEGEPCLIYIESGIKTYRWNSLDEVILSKIYFYLSYLKEHTNTSHRIVPLGNDFETYNGLVNTGRIDLLYLNMKYKHIHKIETVTYDELSLTFKSKQDIRVKLMSYGIDICLMMKI